MRPLRFSVLLIGGLVVGNLLAACAAGPESGPVAGGTSSTTLDSDSAQPTASDQESPAGDTETASLPPLPRLEPDEVLHYSRAQLVAALGAPAFRRVDKGAEILRFKGRDCVVDVFLYADGPDSTARVAHMEARDDHGGSMDRAKCLNEIPRRRG